MLWSQAKDSVSGGQTDAERDAEQQTDGVSHLGATVYGVVR